MLYVSFQGCRDPVFVFGNQPVEEIRHVTMEFLGRVAKKPHNCGRPV